uniref:Uncharacterized protein n=1 Tax=Ciona intestinalis TaxID=7719 RepID=H2XZ62_CIOIN
MFLTFNKFLIAEILLYNSVNILCLLTNGTRKENKKCL